MVNLLEPPHEVKLPLQTVPPDWEDLPDLQLDYAQIWSDEPEPEQLTEARYRLIRAYSDLGTTFYTQNEFEQAIAHFHRALDEAGDLPGAELAKLHCNIGLAQVRLGQFEEAVSSFQASLMLNPEDHKTKFHLDRIDYERSNFAKGYCFSQDWFSRSIPGFWKHLLPFVGQPDLKALEIGSWEGRSTCWLLEHVLTHDASTLHCIDTFCDSAEHRFKANTTSQTSIETVFDANLRKSGFAHKVTKQVGRSQDLLRSLPLNAFDFIYVDGSHRAGDALTDAVLSWGLLKPGGILIFDDYDVYESVPGQNTRMGIDAFLNCFADQIRVVQDEHLIFVEKLMGALP
jgi:predicted O-methyltransferase YrrM